MTSVTLKNVSKKFICLQYICEAVEHKMNLCIAIMACMTSVQSPTQRVK